MAGGQADVGSEQGLRKGSNIHQELREPLRLIGMHLAAV